MKERMRSAWCGLLSAAVAVFSAASAVAADYSFDPSVNYAKHKVDGSLEVCFTCTGNGLDMRNWVGKASEMVVSKNVTLNPNDGTELVQAAGLPYGGDLSSRDAGQVLTPGFFYNLTSDLTLKGDVTSDNPNGSALIMPTNGKVAINLNGHKLTVEGSAAEGTRDVGRADELDEANIVLKHMLDAARRERNAAFMQMTDEEGLAIALKRADFIEARRFAFGVLKRNPKSEAANFGVGMSYLLENSWTGRCRIWRRRSSRPTCRR